MGPNALINSRQAAPVARAHRLLTRSGREAAGLFLVEGPRCVREAVASGRVVDLFVTEEAAGRCGDIVVAAAQHGARVCRVTDSILGYLADTVTPQGMVAVVPMLAATLGQVLSQAPRLIVVLEQVQDPGNVGTVIRIADAVGADAVVTTANTVDVFNPKCVRSSAGSLFHVPLIVDRDLSTLSHQLGTAGITRIAAVPDSALSIFDRDARQLLARPSAWFFGNESNGLSIEAIESCDTRMAVPIFGKAESLNLAAAAAVCLYAAANAMRRG